MTMNNSQVFWPVPHYCQFDPRLGLPKSEQAVSCAIVAMKMVIDFWQTEPIDTRELRDLVTDCGGRSTTGDWRHAAEVKAFTKLGFISWRRNWNLARRDYDYFVDEEDYSRDQVELLQFQNYGEALPSLTQSLNLGLPAIVSVKKNFEAGNPNHQIILRGYDFRKTKKYFYFLDPYLNDEDQDETDPIDLVKFLQYFNYQAIFAVPAGLKERFYEQTV